MNFSVIKTKIPDRAIASILFSCFCILVRRIFFSLEWLPITSIPDHFDVPDRLYIPIMVSLQTGFRGLVAASVVWCIWSWFTERRLPAIVATIFTALALFDVFLIK